MPISAKQKCCSRKGRPSRWSAKKSGPLGPGEVFVWDITKKTRVATFEGQTSWVSSVDFNKDGSQIVSASPGGQEILLNDLGQVQEIVIRVPEIRVWRTATGELVTRFQKHKNAITSAKFSPDGTRVVSAARSDAIRVWKAETGVEDFSIPYGGSNGATNVAVEPKGKLLAAGMLDWSVRVWDAETGKQVHEFRDCHAHSLTFHPDLPKLAVVSKFPKPTLQIWDVRTGREAKALDSRDNLTFAVAFHPMKRILATASPQGSVREWDLVTAGQLRHLQRGTATWVCYGPNGDRLAIGKGNSVELHDLAEGTPPITLSAPPQPGRPMRFRSFAAAYSADGQVVAAPPLADRKVRVSNAMTGAVMKEFDSAPVSGTAVSLSPDGKILALAGSLGERRRRIEATKREGTIRL